jgi:putative flippase GtrA
VNNKALFRFLKYSVIGFTTFLLDLLLLYFFTEILQINYLVSTALAFIIAVSINYHYSRKFVFSKTKRGVGQGYYIFLTIAGLGLLLVVLLMALFVEVLNFNYVLARIIIAGMVGIYNYLINLFFNFKVAGHY